MNAWLNGEKIDPAIADTFLNRGFRFGDGCFETMLAKDGQVPLLDLHVARLKKSLAVLDLQLPDTLSLAAQISGLCEGTTGWHRVRLWIWRGGSGLYQPETTKADYMLAAMPCASPALLSKQQAYYSEEVRLLPSRWSFIKSLNTLPYVMAGLEKKRRTADELILLNHRGEIAEATSANLFWKKRGRWYTPALESGCVAGVMRSWLMRKLLEKGKPAFEVLAAKEELKNADQLVCTNVSGLSPVIMLEGKTYDSNIATLWELLPEVYQES